MSEGQPVKTKLTLWVPEDVIEEAKHEAIRQKRSVSEIVTELLRQALNLPEKPQGRDCHA